MKRKLILVAGSFAVAGIISVAALSGIDLGSPSSPDLVDGGALAAASFGAVGLLIALRYWSRSGETSATPESVQIGFIIRVAIAEMGLLIGILALFMTGATTPAWIGLGLFLIALVLLTLGLRRIPE